jgi:hypothetical protein
MNSKTHSPSCATNGLNIGARNRVIVLAQRQNLGFRPFLSFAFICPSINSARRLSGCHSSNDSADLERNSLLNGTGNFCEGTGEVERKNREFELGIVRLISG